MKKNTDKYEEWVKKVTEEGKGILLTGLDVENSELFEKMLNTSFELT